MLSGILGTEQDEETKGWEMKQRVVP